MASAKLSPNSQSNHIRPSAEHFRGAHSHSGLHITPVHPFYRVVNTCLHAQTEQALYHRTSHKRTHAPLYDAKRAWNKSRRHGHIRVGKAAIHSLGTHERGPKRMSPAAWRASSSPRWSFCIPLNSSKIVHVAITTRPSHARRIALHLLGVQKGAKRRTDRDEQASPGIRAFSTNEPGRVRGPRGLLPGEPVSS